MTVNDVEDTIYPPCVALSPGLVLARNWEIIQKYGEGNFTTRREFKRAREMYQTAVYALGQTVRTGDFYWVTPGSDNTPDCYLIWKNGNGLSVECVEITLWNKHVDEMWKIIEKKICKQYPFHFSIVIHDSHEEKSVSSQYYQYLHERLKECAVTVGAVRFWMEITNKDESDVLLGELYPENSWTEFSSRHVLAGYALVPQIIRIDVTLNPRRIRFSNDDLHCVTLPALPELQWS